MYSAVLLPGSTRSSASVPVLVLPGLSARQRYVAESGGWTRLTCSEPDGSAASRESVSKVRGRSSRFFCQRMMGVGSPETSQRNRAVSPRYEETDSVGTTTFRGPGGRQEGEGFIHRKTQPCCLCSDQVALYIHVYSHTYIMTGRANGHMVTNGDQSHLGQPKSLWLTTILLTI